MTKKKKQATLAKTERLRVKVGASLRKWRLGENLVLTQISKRIKISQGSLSDIENGKSLPAFQTILNLKKKYPRTEWDEILFA